MGNNTNEPHSPTPEAAEAAGGTLPGDTLDLVEAASKVFRLYLYDFLREQLRGMPAHSDPRELIGGGALRSVLRMIETEEDCRLSAAQFSRIVGESSFKKVLGAGEPSPQQATGVEVENWETRNRQRLALIRRSLTERLTPEEESELEHLQIELDKRLESYDDRLLAHLQRMKKAAEQLPEGP